MSKRISIMWFVVASVVLLALACSASELRGLWVDAFHPGIMTPAQTAEMVAKAKDAGFNAIFVQVRKRGDAYYTSTIEPRADNVQPGYDALADVIGKAHKAGIEVHAWVSVLDVFVDSSQYYSKAGHVAMNHPDWLMKTKEGSTTLRDHKVMLDPGIPEARRYTVSVIADIVRRYDVDGIHLDNVRYMSENSGYSAASLAAFNRQFSKAGTPDEKDAAWSDWRRAQVTQMVREIHTAVSALKPGVKLSASVFGRRNVAHDYFFQDWDAWMSEGILDFAVPMVFALDDKEYQSSVDDVLACAHGRQICIGQGAWRLKNDQTIRQIEYARAKGAAGVVVYNYDYTARPDKDGATTLGAIKARLFAKPDATPAMSWKTPQ